MSGIGELAAKAAAAFLVETAKGVAGPVTQWLQQRLGTQQAAEQLAADVDDGDAKAELIDSVQRELEAHPSLESALRQTLGPAGLARHAPQTASSTGGNATIIQIQGDNSTVKR